MGGVGVGVHLFACVPFRFVQPACSQRGSAKTAKWNVSKTRRERFCRSFVVPRALWKHLFSHAEGDAEGLG